jgi:hypothetical protein
VFAGPNRRSDVTHPTLKLTAPLLAASCSTLGTGFGSKGARTAANDDAAAQASSADRNSLWIILIGMACIIAVAAAP